MKRLIVILIIVMIPLSTMAMSKQRPNGNNNAENDATKSAMENCVNTIEVMDGTPSRPYNLLSILTEKPLLGGTNTEKLLGKLKIKACKLGADALIKYECHEVTVGGSNAFGNRNTVSEHGHIDVVAVCTGTAVKWK